MKKTAKGLEAVVAVAIVVICLSLQGNFTDKLFFLSLKIGASTEAFLGSFELSSMGKVGAIEVMKKRTCWQQTPKRCAQ